VVAVSFVSRADIETSVAALSEVVKELRGRK
jgi:hypothetical protein